MNMVKSMNLLEMLEYMRPEGSETQKEFCDTYLLPVMGEPDRHRNYIKIVDHANGGLPQVCFTAHHDTVHMKGGKQKLVITGDKVMSAGSNCLGADCTTGVWLILHMIANGIPGIYVVHAGEEVGCVGSSNLIADYGDDPTLYPWLTYTKAVISFDRKGEESIITHQLGQRTCSDDFAISLAKVLGMPKMRPDNTGAYTDSNEYIYTVGECTNLSVGYLAQHTRNESQDIFFAHLLLNKLLSADWSKLQFFKEPEIYTPWQSRWDNLDGRGGSYEDYAPFKKSVPQASARVEKMNMNTRDLYDMIMDHPEELAELLDKLGVDANKLFEQMEEELYEDEINPYHRGAY